MFVCFWLFIVLVFELFQTIITVYHDIFSKTSKLLKIEGSKKLSSLKKKISKNGKIGILNGSFYQACSNKSDICQQPILMFSRGNNVLIALEADACDLISQRAQVRNQL